MMLTLDDPQSTLETVRRVHEDGNTIVPQVAEFVFNCVKNHYE